jgi:RNA polymerase sigma factor (sigma-70 family)
MIIATTRNPLDELSTLDETLVEYTRLGSDAAFAVLVERHGDAVYTIARNMCAASSEADELTLRTFISACRAIRSMGLRAGFRTWLYGTAIRTALAARPRRGSTATRSPEPLPAPCDGVAHQMPLAGKWPELTGRDFEGSDLAMLLREALERIDDGVRAAFVLCDLAELPAKEAAALLQTSPREIGRRVHRARLMLISVLDELFQELDP